MNVTKVDRQKGSKSTHAATVYHVSYDNGTPAGTLTEVPALHFTGTRDAYDEPLYLGSTLDKKIRVAVVNYLRK